MSRRRSRTRWTPPSSSPSGRSPKAGGSGNAATWLPTTASTGTSTSISTAISCCSRWLRRSWAPVSLNGSSHTWSARSRVRVSTRRAGSRGDGKSRPAPACRPVKTLHHRPQGTPVRRPAPFLLLLIATSVSAQTSMPASDTPEAAFRRLDLPTPNAVRTGSGEPGPGYWQQRADYVIRASLDTASRSVRGEERITYTNNSPDTLRYVWLHVEQNLFNSESRGYRVFGQDPRFGTKGAEVSVRLLKVGQPAMPAVRARAGAPARPAAPA